MQVQPYLFFEGRCEEALTFYREKLGAEVDAMMRFRESPERPPEGAVAPGSDEKIMHAAFRIGETAVMASDGGCTQAAEFKGFSLSLSVANEAEARRCFEALSDGGQAIMPVSRTFFAPAFGMVRDRFGVSWMVVAMS